MQELKDNEPTGKSGNNHLNKNNNAQKRDPPPGSVLSKPDIIWLQNKENRTKIEGGQGNLWISNKPLWVSEVGIGTENTEGISHRQRSRSVHKEKKYIVVSMRGDQIRHIHGAYRDNMMLVSRSRRRGSGGDKPKPSKPKEE